MRSLILILVLFIFAGCSSDTADQATQQVQQGSNIIEMVPEQHYSVAHGDHLEKTSADTVVTITTNIQDNTTDVVLISGTAQIIRAD